MRDLQWRNAHGAARRAWIGVVVSIWCGGCYSAVEVEHGALHPGVRVYVDLTETGTTDLARYLGPNARRVYGDVSGSSDSAIVVSVRSVTDRRAIETLWSGERVPVPRTEIADIRERRLSKQKSWIFGTAFAAGLALVGRSFAALGGGEAHRGDAPVGQ